VVQRYRWMGVLFILMQSPVANFLTYVIDTIGTWSRLDESFPKPMKGISPIGISVYRT